MRVLAIETSSTRGSVAALDAGGPQAVRIHDEPNRHAELVLSLVDAVVREAGWQRSAIERVAVGIGPGSFTGVRVGVALGQGIALGLGVPLVGVSSLFAMAMSLPATEQRPRAALLDARRGDFFVAAYAASGAELLAPCVVAGAELEPLLSRIAPDLVCVGDCSAVTPDRVAAQSDSTRLPHALSVAILGSRFDPDALPVLPLYVQGASASVPVLRPSPFSRERQAPRP